MEMQLKLPVPGLGKIPPVVPPQIDPGAHAALVQALAKVMTKAINQNPEQAGRNGVIEDDGKKQDQADASGSELGSICSAIDSDAAGKKPRINRPAISVG
jgi:hypothetical protein